MNDLLREDWLQKGWEWLSRLPWRRSCQPLFLLLLLLIAQQLAILTWRLTGMIQPYQAAVWQPAGQGLSGSSRQGESDLGAITRLALFGKAAPTEEAGQDRAIAADAPQTRLNVQLTGVLASSDPAKSIAIIANGGVQNSYGVGDIIDGTQAKIRQVYPDRVIIEHQGRDETLMLDGEEYGKPLPTAHVDNTLGGVREELLQNPGKLTDYVTIEPVRVDGRMAGYRLNPGRDPELFNRLGLQANDMAVSINGLDLKDTAQAMQAMQQLAGATEMTVTVEREGQLYDVFVGLSE
ncbi:GspC family type II secretion system variant ExeC [Aeromonas schubertii]|uniref:GspC family type II secretion system variant ExeC n=1 Tax=Aeromonas schubertii TaxID=652 RepID=UPI001CC69ED3|nr:GspC family type II secretion system variant ExeC [Aeromonas schubertii]MBZ6074510.1 GspC family type II secretion system variant ExeC [Aeromonas schubertii]